MDDVQGATASSYIRSMVTPSEWHSLYVTGYDNTWTVYIGSELLFSSASDRYTNKAQDVETPDPYSDIGHLLRLKTRMNPKVLTDLTSFLSIT